MAGTLSGFTVIELAGIGPAPFAAMMLADMGAEVIQVDRVSAAGSMGLAGQRVLSRNRRSIALDLKQASAVATLQRMIDAADGLIEGFRPGVMERFGLGPQECLARNPRLVYGRMTGWGQEGPYAMAAGHDINYISLAGVLAHCGRAEVGPVPPMNLLGDFGGGGMFLAFGVVAALLERERSGFGQVVETAMVDGAATLAAFTWGLRATGQWDESGPGTNPLDTGAHYYDVYECADGKHVSVGAVEPQFYALLLDKIGLADRPEFAGHQDRESWAPLKAELQVLFRTKSRDEWCELLEYTDVCFAPVLTMSEAAQHPHNRSRGTFVEYEGVLQPSPSPRFSRTPSDLRSPACIPGDSTRDVLQEWGFSPEEVDGLFATGAAL